MNLPKSAKELFDDHLPHGMKAWPDKIREIGAIFGFDIEGDDGGFWTVDCASAPPQVHSQNLNTAQVTITLGSADFVRMLTDYNAGLSLYLEGKLRITGDEKLALKLGQFFAITRVR